MTVNTAGGDARASPCGGGGDGHRRQCDLHEAGGGPWGTELVFSYTVQRGGRRWTTERHRRIAANALELNGGAIVLTCGDGTTAAALGDTMRGSRRTRFGRVGLAPPPAAPAAPTVSKTDGTATNHGDLDRERQAATHGGRVFYDVQYRRVNAGSSGGNIATGRTNAHTGAATTAARSTGLGRHGGGARRGAGARPSTPRARPSAGPVRAPVHTGPARFGEGGGNRQTRRVVVHFTKYVWISAANLGESGRPLVKNLRPRPSETVSMRNLRGVKTYFFSFGGTTITLDSAVAATDTGLTLSYERSPRPAPGLLDRRRAWCIEAASVQPTSR